MEATIQAQLQAKIDSGASKADLLASMGDSSSAFTQSPVSLVQPRIVYPAISFAVKPRQPNP